MVAGVAFAMTGFSGLASAQHHAHSDSLAPFTLGAQAIGLITHQSPALNGSKLTEGYLTQPTVMGHGSVNYREVSGQVDIPDRHRKRERDVYR